jgi:hypothetical protein
MKTRLADPLPFRTLVKSLVDKHFNGDLKPASETLGVHPQTLKAWIDGVREPRFQTQTTVMSKLRSL